MGNTNFYFQINQFIIQFHSYNDMKFEKRIENDMQYRYDIYNILEVDRTV